MGPAHGNDAGAACYDGCGCAPAALRGTAFGFFNLVSGVAMLVASILGAALGQIRRAPDLLRGGRIHAACARLAAAASDFIQSILTSNQVGHPEDSPPC